MGEKFVPGKNTDTRNLRETATQTDYVADKAYMEERRQLQEETRDRGMQEAGRRARAQILDAYKKTRGERAKYYDVEIDDVGVFENGQLFGGAKMSYVRVEDMPLPYGEWNPDHPNPEYPPKKTSLTLDYLYAKLKSSAGLVSLKPYGQEDIKYVVKFKPVENGDPTSPVFAVLNTNFELLAFQN